MLHLSRAYVKSCPTISSSWLVAVACRISTSAAAWELPADLDRSAKTLLAGVRCRASKH